MSCYIYIKAPQGVVVSTLSQTPGVGVSAKTVVLLLPGDVVLADRGFNVAETVGMIQARLY